MEYNIISADGHIDLAWLPHDLFVSNAPARLRDRVPRVVETVKGKRWYADGKDLLDIGFIGGPSDMTPLERGSSQHVDRMHELGFYEGEPHATNPEMRIKDQGVDGVDAEVIYGILGTGIYIDDLELRTAVYQIYNDWAADFSKTNPDRFVCLACIPNDDPEMAAGELRRAAGLGLRGADFAVSTSAKPIWHRDLDPLWAAADECNMPISFHTTGLSVREPSDAQMAEAYYQQHLATFMTVFQLVGAEFLASIVFSGALDRYPGFKFVLGECGATWIPYVLARMDQEYDDRFHHLNFSLKPSELWRRQGHTTFQYETSVADIVHLVGEDNIMWGSDYPHGDGVWPDSLKVIEENLGSLDEDVRRKITRDNAGKLYGLLK